MLDLSAVERLGVTRKTLPLALAAGLAVGLVVASGMGFYLILLVAGVAVLAASVYRPDLAVASLIIVVPFYGSRALVSLPGLPDVTLTRVLALWTLIVIVTAIRRQSAASEASRRQGRRYCRGPADRLGDGLRGDHAGGRPAQPRPQRRAAELARRVPSAPRRPARGVPLPLVAT